MASEMSCSRRPTEPFAFAATRWVLSQCAPSVAALTHVLAIVDASLGAAHGYDLAAAARTDSRGLFEHVARHVDSQLEERERSRSYALAMDMAIRGGSLAMVQCVHDHHPEPLPSQPMRTAVQSGQLEILKWLFANRHDETCAPLPPARYMRRSLNCCLNVLTLLAVASKHLHILRWLVEHGCEMRKDREIAIEAAREGDLEMIKWLHKKHAHFCEQTMEDAARHGYLDVVRFLYRRRKESHSRLALAFAIAYNHDGVAAYLRSTKIQSDLGAGLLCVAAGAGRVDLLEQYTPLVVSEDIAWKFCSVLDSALKAQSLECLKWLHQNHHFTDMPVVLAVTERPPDLSVFQWIHDTGCGQWTKHVLDLAVQYDHVELVEWLYAHVNDKFDGCRNDVFSIAARYGHLDVLCALHKLHGSRSQASFAFDSAASRGHLHIVKWLQENCSVHVSPFTLFSVIEAGHRETALWLFGRFPGFTDQQGNLYESKDDVEEALERVERERLGVCGSLQMLSRGKQVADEDHRRALISQCMTTRHQLGLEWLAAQFPHSFRPYEREQMLRRSLYHKIATWVRAIH